MELNKLPIFLSMYLFEASSDNLFSSQRFQRNDFFSETEN